MITTAKAVSTFGVLALLTAAFACGGADNSTFDGGGGGGGGDDGGLSDVAFSDGSGGGGDDGSGGGDGAGCNAPVDMYIMFDRSGSMGKDCDIGGTTNSKWCHSVNALAGYFKSSGATSQAAALQFFPVTNHTAALCGTGDTYNVPAAPSGTPAYTDLPSTTFDSLLNATTTDNNNGGTPTEAAIRGMTRFTAANRRGGRVTIGILITDGNPNGCDEDLTNLSNLLAAHYSATQVRTYVIGMQGADFANLEAIAAGGGSPMHPDTVGAITNACGGTGPNCRSWNVGDGNPTVFTAALAAIQDSANGCKDGGGFVNPR